MEISSKMGPFGGGRVISMSACPPLTASRCNINGCATELSTRIAARDGRDTAESLLPVIVPA
jgi:hypothetical protein